VISGASESGISPISMACFDPIRATSARNDEPESASRPFDGTRDGFVMGEGGAVLVLEELEHARARGARVYCEVTGYAGRGNAFHMTGLKPDGLEMAEAIADALRQGGTDPADVDYVNAHGSGTRQNDIHETAAVKRALGEHAYRVPISSIKSMVGHSLGGIGAIEIAASALAIEHGIAPPTANLDTSDPACDLDYVPRTARELPIDVVLCTGSGFGGFQSAIVLAREGAS
jgi:minimal PKS ketosynthase (KS/KS alpha)